MYKGMGKYRTDFYSTAVRIIYSLHEAHTQETGEQIALLPRLQYP